MRYATALGLGTVIAAAIIGGACGGQTLDPNAPQGGYLDDAGVFHLPDGGLLTPGSGCIGFKPSAWASKIDAADIWGAQVSAMKIPCTGDGDCAFIPPGYPVGRSICVDDLPPDSGSVCAIPDDVPKPCNPGPSGDQYCAALFQQFVAAKDATAIAHCVDCGHWNASNMRCGQGVCLSGCKWPIVDTTQALFVQRTNNPPRCENPCEP